MIQRIVIALEAAVLALWAGAMAGFAFVFAPIAIKIVPRMDVFATLIASTIRGVASFGNVCGAIALAASAVRLLWPAARGLALLRIVLVAVALGASAYEIRAIIPQMERTAAAIGGPVDSVLKSDPRREAYDASHKASTRVYGLAFLCVLAAVVFVPFGRARED